MPARMENRELFASETALPHQSNGERVADRQRDGCTIGRRHRDRVSLLRDSRFKRRISLFGQRAILIGGDGNRFDIHPCGVRQQFKYFTSFTAVGDQQQNVVGTEDSKIAVCGFGGVQKYRWRASAAKRRGSFSSDTAHFPHSRYDQSPFAAENDFDGGLGRVADKLRGVGDRLRF